MPDKKHDDKRKGSAPTGDAEKAVGTMTVGTSGPPAGDEAAAPQSEADKVIASKGSKAPRP